MLHGFLQFCRTTGGISLNDKDFTIFWIFVGTIRKFSRKGSTLKCCLSSCQITCFPGCLSGTLGQQRFSQIFLATSGFCSRKYVSCSVTTESTAPRASLFPSFCLVCPSNCGSSILILIIAVNPSRISSPVSAASLSFKILLPAHTN